MACQKCKSERVLGISGKCSDCCFASIGGGKEKDGYVPSIKPIGGGDYVTFKVCLDCGQMQGTFPVPLTELEEENEAEPLLVEDVEGDHNDA